LFGKNKKLERKRKNGIRPFSSSITTKPNGDRTAEKRRETVIQPPLEENSAWSRQMSRD